MTMDQLQPGQTATTETVVTVNLTINRMGKADTSVLSTPSLLSLMELCCIEASDKYLCDNYTTVGYAVDQMRHTAPTPIGAKVTVKAELTKIEKNKLTYSIKAFEGEKEIGVAIHKRAVISKDTDI